MDNKKGNEWVELTERDKQMLKLLAKFKVMTAVVILALVGMADNYGRKRIQKLVRCGYIEKSMIFVNKPAIYTPTSKGLSAIGSDYPYYNIHNDNAYHEAVVAMTAAWLHIYHDIPMKDILPEREMKRHGIKFGGKERTRPDLYIPKISLCVEYERHAKTTEKTKRKIVNNASNCEKQLWILEEDDKALAKRISKIHEQEDYLETKIAMLTREFIERKMAEGVTENEKKVVNDFLFG